MDRSCCTVAQKRLFDKEATPIVGDGNRKLLDEKLFENAGFPTSVT